MNVLSYYDLLYYDIHGTVNKCYHLVPGSEERVHMKQGVRIRRAHGRGFGYRYEVASVPLQRHSHESEESLLNF